MTTIKTDSNGKPPEFYPTPQPWADRLGFSNPMWAEKLSPDW